MKKIIISLAALLICNFAHAEDVVTYSGTTYLNCTSIGDTNVFLTNPNDYGTIKAGYIYVANGCGSLPGIAKYRKISNGQVVEMSQAEKDSLDAAELAAKTLATRAGAKSNLVGFSENPLYQRAVADSVNDRENTIAGRVNDIMNCLDNNSTIGAVRTCVAALQDLPASVTLTQVKTTIQNKIDSGGVDN